MPGRFGDLQVPTHLSELLAAPEQLVALGQLADDLIRRMPPALVRCHVVVDSFWPAGRATESHSDWTATRGAPHFGEHTWGLSMSAINLKYGTRAAVFNAADYGVPQVRRRVFIVGVRDQSPSVVARLFEKLHERATHRGRWRTVHDILDPQANDWMRWWYDDITQSQKGT